MDCKAVLKSAEGMASKAKNGTLKLAGVTYSLTFDRKNWVYRVTASDGSTFPGFNTKRLSDAKKLLQDYLA